MAHGGARPGAGKKKGSKASHTIEAQEAKKLMIASFLERQKEVDNALLEKAVTGDVPAIKEVYDRVYGKAVNPVEMSGKDGKDLFNPESKERAIGAIRSFVVGDLGAGQ